MDAIEQVSGSPLWIGNCDEDLLNWTDEILGENIGRLGLPPWKPKGRGIGIHLLEITPERLGKAASDYSHVELRYLITAWADREGDARELLTTLLLAAIGNPRFEVEEEKPSKSFWHGHGLTPRPCFVIRQRAWQEPYVQRNSEYAFAALPPQSLQGVVYGPEGDPLAGAIVRLPSANRSTRTGKYGEFVFHAVPSYLGKLRVEAHGRSMTLDLRDLDTPSSLAIHFELP